MHDQPNEIPYGYCHCGCGRKAPISTETRTERGYRKGEPTRFIKGHGFVAKAGGWRAEDCGYATPCWVWERAKTPQGYAVRGVRGGGIVKVATLMYVEAFGPVPRGLVLDHLCRNRACVRPDHLEPVTPAENVRRGAGTKLTRAKVDEIRRSPLSCRAIGRLYGIDHSHVSKIRRGLAWRDAA